MVRRGASPRAGSRATLRLRVSAPENACPHCHVPLAPAEVLDAGTVAIPAACVVQFRCPRCSVPAWARLGDGTLALGPAQGDPARFPAAAAPDLSVRPDCAWMDCWYAGKYRRYPARREAA
jgi:hypothetical protein